MNKVMFTIIKKELKRVFTDRRLIFTSFILPALSIALIYSLTGMMINNSIEDIEGHRSEVAFINKPSNIEEHIDFEEYNINQHAIIDIPTTEIEELLLDTEYDAIVEFDSDFQEKIMSQTSSIPTVLVHRNGSEEYSAEAYYKLNNLLDEYRQDLLLLRVENENFIQVFNIDKEKELEIIIEKKLNSQGFGMVIPMLISIFLFTGATGIGMDSIAGEKERGTMATLLVTPIKRTDIIIGKLISISIVALLSTLSSFTGIFLSLPFSGYLFGQSEGEIMNALGSFSVTDGLMVFIVMISLVGIYVGLITTISMYAKSVKEASTYMTPVYMAIMMTSIFNMMDNKAAALWKFSIPVYGNVMALKSIFLGTVHPLVIIMTFVSSVLFTSVLVIIIRKMFDNEKIMFPN